MIITSYNQSEWHRKPMRWVWWNWSRFTLAFGISLSRKQNLSLLSQVKSVFLWAQKSPQMLYKILLWSVWLQRFWLQLQVRTVHEPRKRQNCEPSTRCPSSEFPTIIVAWPPELIGEGMLMILQIKPTSIYEISTSVSNKIWWLTRSCIWTTVQLNYRN